MNESYKEKEKKEKKISNKVLTFPIPFSLIEIKENICIYTNEEINIYKEKLINQAISFHLGGNIKEAIKYYQYCIKGE